MEWSYMIPAEPETHCGGCGAELIPTGPPINDTYCPNNQCDHTLKEMHKGIKRAREARERAEYERLKAKYGEP